MFFFLVFEESDSPCGFAFESHSSEDKGVFPLKIREGLILEAEWIRTQFGEGSQHETNPGLETFWVWTILEFGLFWASPLMK